MSEPARRGQFWAEAHPRGAGRPGAAGRTAAVRRRQPRGRQAPLRLVADGGHLVPPPPSPEREPAAPQHAAPPQAVYQVPRATPVRLTRRGRIVVTAAVVLAIGAASLALSGAAQATGHSGAQANPGSGVSKVAIRAGQSLWSVAEADDPDADTRLVIQEIMQMNSLTSDQVQPGEVIWVPRG